MVVVLFFIGILTAVPVDDEVLVAPPVDDELDPAIADVDEDDTALVLHHDTQLVDLFFCFFLFLFCPFLLNHSQIKKNTYLVAPPLPTALRAFSTSTTPTVMPIMMITATIRPVMTQVLCLAIQERSGSAYTIAGPRESLESGCMAGRVDAWSLSPSSSSLG